MSGKRNIPNDGQALTTVDVQRIGDNAASMDDRVYEVLSTPPSLGAKTVIPQGIEAQAFNPRLLCVPGAAPGTVQLQPCALQVGSPTIALAVALEATLKTALASALFGANSSGSTRFDLVYATVQRVVSATGARAIKSTTDGTIANNPSVNLEDTPSITLTILPNVSGVTPLASLPADNNGGANGEAFGSYNFPIAVVAIPNGYVSAGAIAQSIITPLWSGGWLQPQRVRGYQPLSLYSTGSPPPEKVTTQVSDRFGSDVRRFFHLKIRSATPSSFTTLLDNSIDWRNRLVFGYAAYLGSAATALESQTSPIAPIPGSQTQFMFYTGSSGASGQTILTYNSGTSSVGIAADASGNLMFARILLAGPIDAVNGDLIAVFLHATDRFLPTT